MRNKIDDQSDLSKSFKVSFLRVRMRILRVKNIKTTKLGCTYLSFRTSFILTKKTLNFSLSTNFSPPAITTKQIHWKLLILSLFSVLLLENTEEKVTFSK